MIPINAVRRQCGWRGGIYRVAICRGADRLFLFSVCQGCLAPIGAGDLYAPRIGSRPLCLDCVEPA